MSSLESNNNKDVISVKIENGKVNNAIDLESSEHRIINNVDNSLSIGQDNNKSIINTNLNNTKITFLKINFNNNIDKILDSLYGNPYEIKHPKKIGNLRILFYAKDFPLIVIGPECKYLLIIIKLIFI